MSRRRRESGFLSEKNLDRLSGLVERLECGSERLHHALVLGNGLLVLSSQVIGFGVDTGLLCPDLQRQRLLYPCL